MLEMHKSFGQNLEEGFTMDKYFAIVMSSEMYSAARKRKGFVLQSLPNFWGYNVNDWPIFYCQRVSLQHGFSAFQLLIHFSSFPTYLMNLVRCTLILGLHVALLASLCTQCSPISNTRQVFVFNIRDFYLQQHSV